MISATSYRAFAGDETTGISGWLRPAFICSVFNGATTIVPLHKGRKSWFHSLSGTLLQITYDKMIHQVTPSEEEQTIFVTVGDIIELHLNENPTTGYSWTIEEPGPFCSIQKNEFQREENESIGRAGYRVISLKVEQTGTREILLKKWQRWSRSVAETFSLHVQSS